MVTLWYFIGQSNRSSVYQLRCLRTLYISITIHKYHKNQIGDAIKFNFNIKFLIFISIYKIFTKYCYDAFDNAITTLWTCYNYSSDYEATLIFINYVVTVLRLWWYIAVNALLKKYRFQQRSFNEFKVDCYTLILKLGLSEPLTNFYYIIIWR